MQYYVVVTYTASRSLKTHHYCILWIQSTFVIYVVLYPYYMMYSNIVKEIVFQYIEHSILRYDFVYDTIMYLFQVLPLLHWTSEFSKIMIIMYFGHHFPLTSHIRGHLLSTQMALLRLSADIPYVGTQKNILGLKFSKSLWMGTTWDAFTLEPACHIIFLSVDLHM